jgi:hypothetical protein
MGHSGTGLEGWFGEKDQYVANFKKVVLMLLKAASETFTRTLVH